MASFQPTSSVTTSAGLDLKGKIVMMLGGQPDLLPKSAQVPAQDETLDGRPGHAGAKLGKRGLNRGVLSGVLGR